MGIFGNNNKDKEVALHRKIAYDANEVNQEIGTIMKAMGSNAKKFDSLAEMMIDFSEQIADKLDVPDKEKLISINTELAALHENHNNLFRSVMDLSEKQMDRTDKAIEEYERVGTR